MQNFTQLNYTVPKTLVHDRVCLSETRTVAHEQNGLYQVFGDPNQKTEGVGIFFIVTLPSTPVFINIEAIGLSKNFVPTPVES